MKTNTIQEHLGADSVESPSYWYDPKWYFSHAIAIGITAVVVYWLTKKYAKK